MEKIPSSLLEASEQLCLKASENVSDGGQSRVRMSLLDTEVDRNTGILLCDTDEILNAVGTNLVFPRTRPYYHIKRNSTRICRELFEMSG